MCKGKPTSIFPNRNFRSLLSKSCGRLAPTTVKQDHMNSCLSTRKQEVSLEFPSGAWLGNLQTEGIIPCRFADNSEGKYREAFIDTNFRPLCNDEPLKCMQRARGSGPGSEVQILSPRPIRAFGTAIAALSVSARSPRPSPVNQIDAPALRHIYLCATITF